MSSRLPGGSTVTRDGHRWMVAVTFDESYACLVEAELATVVSMAGLRSTFSERGNRQEAAS